MGSALDLLVDWLGWSMEEVRLHWNWAPGSGFLNNEFSLTWWLARNRLPLFGLNFKDCRFMTVKVDMNLSSLAISFLED